MKSHCPQGHEYNKTNTYLYGKRRYCKICKRERQIEKLREKQKQQLLKLLENIDPSKLKLTT